MRALKKILLWLLMVAVLAALVVGGAVGYFYFQAGPGEAADAPLTVQTGPDGGASTEHRFVAPVGYALRVPVLGGVLYRDFEGADPSAEQELQRDQLEGAPLSLPQGYRFLSIQVDGTSGTLFSGTEEAYSAFTYPGNGRYLYRIQAEAPPAGEGERARAHGVLNYKFTVKVSVELNAFLSEDRVKQGEILAVRIENNLDGIQPFGESALGPVNFIPSGEDGWVAFVPVAYNREAGDYTVEVSCGDFSASLPVAVEYKPYEKKEFASAADLPDAAQESAAASSQYRDAIWPLYDAMRPSVLWQGIFQKPVEGLVKYEYGMGSLLPGASVSQRHSGVDYTVAADNTPVTAPGGGEVFYAGNLALTGNTVVIEHGGGVKSYLYHLSSLAVTGGQTVEKGQQIGTLDAAGTLHYEIKIGNQSVDPAPVFSGQSGLYR